MLGIPIDKGPRKIWPADCWAFGNGVSFVRWLGDAVTNSRRELKDRASDERSVARARWPMLAVAIALTAFCLAPAAGAAKLWRGRKVLRAIQHLRLTYLARGKQMTEFLFLGLEILFGVWTGSDFAGHALNHLYAGPL